MKKRILILATILVSGLTYGQSISDLFTKSDSKITFLGIDYSQVKLIGSFSQFNEAGVVGPVLLKNKYFAAWNDLIIREKEKYDVAGIFRKEQITFSTNVINEWNSKAKTEVMEVEVTPNYSIDFIKNEVSQINFEEKEGYGILFIAESLNKDLQEGVFHFVVLDMNTKNVLLQERMIEPAGGFGLRNYWAKCVFEVIREARDYKFKEWKKKYIKK